MVFPAGQAQTYTLNSANVNAEQELSNETQLTESAIRAAAGQERYKVIYNATVIGNPTGDPLSDDNLTSTQIAYRDSLLTSGYKVGLDEDTGYWLIDWSISGPEQLVTIYSIRTTETPGAIQTTTLNQISSYFSGVTPSVDVNPFAVAINGGDIDESDFGGTPSVFYEYIVIATQQNSADHSSGLKTSLVANITEYTTLNIQVYKLN